MQRLRPGNAEHAWRHWRGAMLLSVCGSLLLSGLCPFRAASAQERNGMLPPSVVLVLKLVTKDFVRPTTGLVISADGKVVVAAGFVQQGDEIVVLDGGTDIARNGRPATTIRRSVADGVAVLQVDGLERPAATLADSAAVAGAPLYFAAFPPARKIAQGAAPLWQPLTAAAGKPGALALAPESSMPAVSGFLFDRCGHVAGMARGGDDISAGGKDANVLLSAEQLNRVLNGMQLEFARGPCGGSAQKPTKPEAVKPEVVKPPAAAEQPKAVSRHQEPTQAAPQAAEVTAATAEPGSGAGAVSSAEAPPPAGAAAGAEQPAPRKVHRTWPLWLLVPLLAALVFWRARRRSPGNASIAAAPSTEPETTELGKSPAIGPQQPRAAGGAVTIPGLESLPPECRGMLLFDGQTAGGERLRAYATFGPGALDILIGRGADGLDVRSAAVSRAHARIAGPPDALTLSDLGSSNGTFINGVPCLGGEIMYIRENDDIQIGDVRARLSVRTRSEPEP